MAVHYSHGLRMLNLVLWESPAQVRAPIALNDQPTISQRRSQQEITEALIRRSELLVNRKWQNNRHIHTIPRNHLWACGDGTPNKLCKFILCSGSDQDIIASSTLELRHLDSVPS
jgi:hypothetical protein